VFIATQLNSTQLTKLNSVQPNHSCFCLWRQDLQTESTVVHAVELSSVELSCVAINGPLRAINRHHKVSTSGFNEAFKIKTRSSAVAGNHALLHVIEYFAKPLKVTGNDTLEYISDEKKYYTLCLIVVKYSAGDGYRMSCLEIWYPDKRPWTKGLLSCSYSPLL